VLSLDGTSLDQITSSAVHPVVNFTTNEVTRHWKRFLPNGVAVQANGHVYVDTDGTNGYTRVAGIVGVADQGIRGAVLWKGCALCASYTFLDSSAGQSVELHFEVNILTPA
jgi:hypothetical protein